MAEAAKNIEQDFSMKLVIERSVLLKALAKLQSIVERRNTIAILSNIKMEADGNGLRLTTTDMDIVAQETIEASVNVEGSLTVPAQTLYDIVRKLPEGAQISLDSDSASTQLIVKAGSAKFSLSYLPADEFPVMSQGDMSHTFILSSSELLIILNRAKIAMSTEETRYYLNGVYLHATESGEGDAKLRAVATDGHRLSRIETVMPAGAYGMPGVIIPRKTVNELGKLLEEEGENVEVSLSESKIRFASGNMVLLSKLVDGTFPDYSRVIPEGNNKMMEVDTDLLSKSVDRVSIVSTEKTRGIKFSLSSGSLLLSAQSPDSGSAVEEVGINYSSDDLETGFNSKYLLEILGQIEGDTVQFLFSDTNSPTLVNDASDARSLYVIMPMRV